MYKKILLFLFLAAVPLAAVCQTDAGAVVENNAAEEDDTPEDEKIKDALTAYLDIEHAFNNHPWTVECKLQFSEEIRSAAADITQTKEEIEQLKETIARLGEEANNIRPFYRPLYTPEGVYPRPPEDPSARELEDFISDLNFSGAVQLKDSPVNSGAKLDEILEKIDAAAREITEKEVLLAHSRAVNVDEFKAREQREIEVILEDIYSELKKYCLKRNVKAVVNKKEILFGQRPVDITQDFTVRLQKTRKNKKRPAEKNK